MRELTNGIDRSTARHPVQRPNGRRQARASRSRSVLVLLVTCLVLVVVVAPVAAQETGEVKEQQLLEPLSQVLDDRPAPVQQDEGDNPRLLPQRFSLHLEEHLSPLAFAENPFSTISIDQERAYRQALWNAPLGRVYYDMAAQQAMLGREGLVNGGHMLGLGLGLAVVGEGSGGSVQGLAAGTPWSEMSARDRFRVSFETALTASLVWAVANAIN